MNCKRTRRAARSLICGRERDARPIEEHLSVCPRCEQKYRPFLAIVRSLESTPAPKLDEEVWREFSAKLRARIREEKLAPFGRWRSFLLWAGEWKLVRFRRALAASAVIIAIAASVLAFLPVFRTDETQLSTVVQHHPTESPPPFVELPPTTVEAINIFGADGFVTGVLSGYIQAGDVFGDNELDHDDIVEALDYLLS